MTSNFATFATIRDVFGESAKSTQGRKMIDDPDHRQDEDEDEEPPDALPLDQGEPPFAGERERERMDRRLRILRVVGGWVR